MIDFDLLQSASVLPVDTHFVPTGDFLQDFIGASPPLSQKLQFASISIPDPAPIFPSVGQAAEGNTPPPPNK